MARMCVGETDSDKKGAYSNETAFGEGERFYGTNAIGSTEQHTLNVTRRFRVLFYKTTENRYGNPEAHEIDGRETTTERDNNDNFC